MSRPLLLWFRDCSYKNKHLVGGKCCSLGELHRLSSSGGFSIADGFSITTTLYDEFVRYNGLTSYIDTEMQAVDATDISQIEVAGQNIRDRFISSSQFSDVHASLIMQYYTELCALYKVHTLDVAVRSSALAEDMPNASFAGQQDTYLNVNESTLLTHIKKCFASLFNDRAISYRHTHNIQMSDVKISVAVQKMVRSDLESAGVAFSMDPETGYNKAVIINSAFGLGELVVSGGVNPDEFIVDKRVLMDPDTTYADPIILQKRGNKQCKIVYGDSGVVEVPTTPVEQASLSLTDTQAVAIARIVVNLEKSYSELFGTHTGIDVEWAIDGVDRHIYIVQTRPETIHNNNKNNTNLAIHKYILTPETINPRRILTTGVSVGDKISTGVIKNLKTIKEFGRFNRGDILVTDMTTPDWEPVMKIASGIITNKGGRTCHAAIIARELGLNAIVGTSNATELLPTGISVTMSCAEGEQGKVYDGIIPFEIEKIHVNEDIRLPVKLMLNVGNPENSFGCSQIPNGGVGLARMEFIINNYIKIHPIALCNYPHNLPEDVSSKIRSVILDEGYDENKNAKMYFVHKLAKGMAKIASAFYPKDVIVRLSDFKSNEYRNLIGGELYEPNEENPMIGWRGASRYYSTEYEEGFALECEAIKYVRETMKMTNIIVMIPFCRTPTECQLVIGKMAVNGLVRGEHGLQIYIMCEIPSNVIEADEFSPLIDGVSIGGNDLLQLTLGVDRDSDKIAHLSSDTNLSYRRMIQSAIRTYKKHGVKIGFCGQQPSDSAEFCKFLVDEHIDSISVTPDSALKTINTFLHI